ncbi:MAG: YihA family ribosome biogenesis GTP-binding protein [Gemmatimonadetes bacterium]|nr:YihA family ribosome biogenesis GTP-binding protein [Gemmatimonadota bacterium]
MQIKQTDFVKSVAHPSQIPSEDFPQIAFSGRSNVGKSSLINRLMNRRNLAQTSNTPGKTRLLNFYLINRNLHFVDLPGYGFAKRSKAEQKSWAELIDAYLQRSERLRGLVQLIDARHDPSGDDLEMIKWLSEANFPFVVIATKVDKISSTKKRKQLDKSLRIISDVAEVDFLPFSSATGQGRNELLNWIENVI